MITGLLLHFADGCREALGEVRLDSLRHDQALEFDGEQSVFLGFRRDDGRFARAGSIAGSRSGLDLDCTEVLELSRGGRMKWFWSTQQCYVTYQGKRSPPPF